VAFNNEAEAYPSGVFSSWLAGWLAIRTYSYTLRQKGVEIYKRSSLLHENGIELF
jgi:hypothetical protein